MNKFTAISIILTLFFFFLNFLIKNSQLKNMTLLASFIISTSSVIIMDTATTNDYIYSNILSLILSLINLIIILPYYLPIKLKLRYAYFYVVLIMVGGNLLVFIQNLHPLAKTVYPVIQ